DAIILVEAKDPVAFFAYPDKPSILRAPTTEVIKLCDKSNSAADSLLQLADELGVPRKKSAKARTSNDSYISVDSNLTGDIVSLLIAKHLPENAIVCDESITQSKNFFQHSLDSASHDYLQLTGGAIGMGMPLALGASVACSDRKVINLEGDGSGAFTLQALWSQARLNSNCLTVIYANRNYQILQTEMLNMGISHWGANARAMLNLDVPFLDWVSLAKGMGVEASRAETTEQFQLALVRGLASKSPYLIEAII